MTTLGSKVVPESFLEKPEGGLNPTIISEDCQEGGYAAPSTPKHHPSYPMSLSDLFLSTTEKTPPPPLAGAKKENEKAEMKEEDSLSFIEDSSIWAVTSSPSLSSIASSSASSSSKHTLLRNGTGIVPPRLITQDLKQPFKPHKRIDHKKDSFASLLLWPFKKVKDAYMKCMMDLEAAGDLSGLAQGSTFAIPCNYFPKRP